MARDSGDGLTLTSIRPTSAHDAVHQLSSNLSRLSHVGATLWENTRSRLKHQHTPHHRNRHNVLKRRSTNLPSFLLRRTLTLPLPEKEDDLSIDDFEQTTADQTESKLFTRLPYEIRSLIFELVVAGDSNVVHVFKKGKRVGHWRCKRQDGGLPCTWIDPCSKALGFKAMSLNEDGALIRGDRTMQRYFDRSKILISRKDKDIGVLSLLCTCRQTYTETISLLYAKTHFHFPGITDILDFRQHILPDRFDAIRILSVDWEPNPFFIASTPPMRVQTWNTISNMKSLQQLRVYVKTLCVPPDSEAAIFLRKNLGKVVGLQKFELVVTKDLFPVWEGFLDEGMECKLVVNSEASGLESYMARTRAS